MTEAYFHTDNTALDTTRIFTEGSIYVTGRFKLDVETVRNNCLLEIIVFDKMKNELGTLFSSVQDFALGYNVFDVVLVHGSRPFYTPPCNNVYTFRFKITSSDPIEFVQIDDYNVQVVNSAPQELIPGFRGVFEGLSGMHKQFIRVRETYENADGYMDRVSSDEEIITGIFVIPSKVTAPQPEGGVDSDTEWLYTKCQVKKDDIIYPLDYSESREMVSFINGNYDEGGTSAWSHPEMACDGDEYTTASILSPDAPGNFWLKILTPDTFNVDETITKVEIGAKHVVAGAKANASLTLLIGLQPGNSYDFTPVSPNVVPEFKFVDVTLDPIAPDVWTFKDIDNISVVYEIVHPLQVEVLLYEVFIRVTTVRNGSKYKVTSVHDYGDILLCEVVKIHAE